jgi:putative ABC transport system permease protein
MIKKSATTRREGPTRSRKVSQTQNVTAIAERIRTLVGTSATVTDIAHTRSTIGSSLTAVDLAGLTRVELAFALVLAAAAGGLVLALGLTERRRTFAIAAALGATGQQLRGLVAAETSTLAVGGVVAGTGIGWALSEVLVTVLTGVFDPPPTCLRSPGRTWPQSRSPSSRPSPPPRLLRSS